ncbi:MAG TPA: hypothetical protein VG757_08230 [Devosia sp.]|nr:hypothetical protein [Devosia sp.]
MTAVVGSIIAKLQADATGLNSGLTLAGSRVEAFEKRSLASVRRFDAVVSRGFGRAGAVMATFGANLAGTIVGMLGAHAVIAKLRAELDRLGNVADSSAAAGLDPELWQSIAFSAKLGGIEISKASEALATFAANSALAAQNKGRMVQALKATAPELLKEIQLATTQEQRIRAVADALAKEADASKRAAIARATLGDAKFANIFAGGAKAIDDMVAKAKALGIVIDRELVAKADQYGDQWDTAAEILNAHVAKALVNLAPTMVTLVGLAGDFAENLGLVLDSLRATQDRVLLAPLQSELAQLENNIATMKAAIEVQKEANKAGGLTALFQGGDVAGSMANLELMYQRAGELQERIKQILSAPPTITVPDIPDIDPEDLFDTADAVAKVVTALKFEEMQLGRTANAQELYAKLNEAGVTLESDYGQAIMQAVAALQAKRADVEATTAAMQEQAKRLEFLTDLGRDFAHSLKDDLAEGKTAVEALSNAFGRLGDRLIDLALDQAISLLFKNLLGSAFGGASLGGAGNFSIGNVPLYATGTAFHPGGAAIVGERGPELVMMPRGSSVLNASRTADYMRPSMPMSSNLSSSVANDNAGGITIAPVYHIDARGSSMTPAEIRALLEANNKQLRRSLPGMLADARSRGEI